jgi:hypothetical protein
MAWDRMIIIVILPCVADGGGGAGGGGETYIPAKPNMLPEVYHASSQHWNLLGR